MDFESVDRSHEEDAGRLRAHLAEARGRLAEAQAKLRDMSQVEHDLRLSEARFRTLATSLPVGVFQTDAGGDCLFVNNKWRELAGLSEEEALGKGWIKAIHPEDTQLVFDEWYASAQEGREFVLEYRFQTPQGKVSWLSGCAAAVRDQDGAITGYLGTVSDITSRKYAEELKRRTSAQEALIKAQQAALAELSTPLIPISDDIMVMPLIGSLDERRGNQVMEALLGGITRTRARVAILDITGVAKVDAHIARGIATAAQAVKLVGAQLILSGIRPEVAQTFVTLGEDLSSVVTCGTLQSAIAYAQRACQRRKS